MNHFRYILTTIYFASILCSSCVGQEIQRMSYNKEILDRNSLFEIPIKHKNWKSSRISEHDRDFVNSLSPKTIIYIDKEWNVKNLSLPKNIELFFCGGSLKGNIIFNNTYLSGKINLRGLSFTGTIENDIFDAGWICNGDGIHDDATYINHALTACNTIHFPKGTYLLESYHTRWDAIPDELRESISSHIGIHNDDKSLIGDEGASLLVKDAGVAICIYSKIYDLCHSTKDIKISGLSFRNENTGETFHEFIHTLKLVGCKNVLIENCLFFDFWGDAICFSHYGDNTETGERTLNDNVVIRDNYIDGITHNNRNAISIVSGKNVTIDGNTIIETSKPNMPGAIDIEANAPLYTIKNIKIVNNTIDNSSNSGLAIYCNKHGGPAHDIKVINNKITNCRFGIRIDTYVDGQTSDFLFEDNNVSRCNRSIICIGNAKTRNWKFKRNKFAGVDDKEIIGECRCRS